MSLPYNPGTPQAANPIGQTQPLILDNFSSVDKAFNGPTGTPSGNPFTVYNLQNTTPGYAVAPGVGKGGIYTTNSSANHAELSYINDINGTGAPLNGVRFTGGGITAAAWVRFNGTSLAISDQYNVTNITRATGVGDYNVNFTRNFTNTNYACVGSVQTNMLFPIVILDLFGVPTVSTWRVRVGKLTLTPGNPNGQTFTLIDDPLISLVFFGTLV